MQTTKHVAAARRGFSLIELLIVLAILVLLATLVVPKLLGSRDQANIDATKTQISLFKSTLELYSLSMSGYPTTEQGLKALVERPSSDPGEGDEFRDEFGGEDEFGVDEDLADLGGDEDEMDEDGGSEANSNWKGPYLNTEKLPKDPWGTAYRYEFPGQNNKLGEPDIWSLGPDRKDNTADDIVSWSGKRKEGGGDDFEGFDTTEDNADSGAIDLGDE
jgi:general secretion pathway protein G